MATNHSPEYTAQYEECERLLERLPQMLLDHRNEIATDEDETHIDDLKQVARHLASALAQLGDMETIEQYGLE